QRLTSFKGRSLGGFDLDGFFSARITASTRGALAHGKCTEPHQRDIVALLERFGDYFDHRLDSAAGICLGQLGGVGDGAYKFGFVHLYPLEKCAGVHKYSAVMVSAPRFKPWWRAPGFKIMAQTLYQRPPSHAIKSRDFFAR